MSATNTNPSTFIGGTWVAWGSGRVPVGVNTSDTSFNTAEKTGGEKTHTLTIAEMPSHTHNDRWLSSTSGGDGGYYGNSGTLGNNNNYKTLATGGGNAHNNLQPYITCYMFKRTA